ncbi:pantoate--beta-alanine ligase [Riemerella columbina]|uniref:pantoate--beta-alanine ligase n=1 Tax=Riemerella columbina TaxID=103810 RepID=UPI00266F706D|nr:pantoate--beta-alanine ligase [Riemerella columbina]WKS95837.1 pantoate--beta-alanine ligase [Riemerella columbina]
MKILRNKTALAAYISEAKASKKSIGFAPTMGALHQGHLSLYEAARPENDLVISSIFVNPTQFNNPEDLEKYPRTIEEDLKKLEDSGLVDAVYIPEISDIYPEKAVAKSYDFDGLEQEMEGKMRPGHFDGVGTVVESLFSQVQPDRAYFGEKDYQQLEIIKKLVEKQNLPIQIYGVPIYREANGLAMSSRNQRLSATERAEASIIFQTLTQVKNDFKTLSIPEIKQKVEAIFKAQPQFDLEYFLIADEATLKEVQTTEPHRNYRAFIVVNVGGVRLIDNMPLS